MKQAPGSCRPEARTAAAAVAAELKRVERAADETLMHLGSLLQTLPEARLAAGYGVAVGHEALVVVSEATRDLVRFRGRLLRAHGSLSGTALHLGVVVDAAVAGPLEDKGDRDEIGTTRPQGIERST